MIATRRIQLSTRALSEFVTATPSAQRKIVWATKYPDETEPKAILMYYREARSAIAQFFGPSGGPDSLHIEIARLRSRSRELVGAQKCRVESNIDAINSFAKSQLAVRPLKLATSFEASIPVAGVDVRVRPSLCLQDSKGRCHWMQVDFRSDAFSLPKAKIILQLFLAASRQENIGLTAKRAEYHHISSDTTVTGSRHGALLERHIQSACQTFSDIWRAI